MIAPGLHPLLLSSSGDVFELLFRFVFKVVLEGLFELNPISWAIFVGFFLVVGILVFLKKLHEAE